jgi:Family of unknown function (DUF6166)
MRTVGEIAHLYSGTRRRDGTTLVSVNGRILDLRPDFRSQGVTTFDWGYDGRGGPAQLALAMLAHHFTDDERVRRHFEKFMRNLIRHLPAESWTVTGAQIDAICREGGTLPKLAESSPLVL